MTTRDPLAPAFGALTAAGVAFRVVEADAVAAGRADLELAAPDVAAAVAALTPLGFGTAAHFPGHIILGTPSGLELHLRAG